MFQKVLELLLNDKGYTIGSERALKALTCAECLKTWIQREGNKQRVTDFAINLVLSLMSCVEVTSTSKSADFCSREREMWESYYKLCCSQIFRSTWTKFIKESIGFEANPIFF